MAIVLGMTTVHSQSLGEHLGITDGNHRLQRNKNYNNTNKDFLNDGDDGDDNNYNNTHKTKGK